MNKILITGAKGFIGKNLIQSLTEQTKAQLLFYDIGNSEEELKEYLKEADFIFHLAGINRPVKEEDFKKGNSLFTEKIIDILEENHKKTPILITSSIQAEINNPYGISKKEAEEALLKYHEKTGAKIFIYRLPNVFGKWSRPNYNSAVATFCYNISHDVEVWVSDKEKELTLTYIDDVVEAFLQSLEKTLDLPTVYYTISKTYTVTLGDLVDKIQSFRAIRSSSVIPNLSEELTRYLYTTYLSYIDTKNLSYSAIKKEDNRGYFSELLKSKEFGQISISTTHPGIVRGNHYHHTKVEKFIVVKGKGLIKLRKVEEDKVNEFEVNGDFPEIVDIAPGYTHSIENIGSEELITLFWVNEIFNQDKPDTFYKEV